LKPKKVSTNPSVELQGHAGLRIPKPFPWYPHAAVAKRSPILGYNHNVLYRGLVFHVQTEDSGVMSPHLFTHLFHHGVIISTRKLVYDSGSGEESIKSLMQAQHKAVLKDLRRGHFDAKIDEYLMGTPGLLPRGTPDEAGPANRGSVPELARASAPELEAAAPISEELGDLGGALGEALDALGIDSGASAPRRDDDGATRRDLTTPDLAPTNGAPAVPPPTPRTKTADRTSPPTRSRLTSEVEGSKTLDDLGVVSAAISAQHNATIRTPNREFEVDSAPDIEIQLELDDDDPVPRARPRDTDISGYDDHTRPTIDVSSLSPAELQHAIPPRSAPPPTPPERRPPSAVGAASLPPARPITRPPSRPAITPPQVVSRPLASDDPRSRRESDAVEVYAPAPPSADAPPGMGSERPGQYSQHKKISTRIPTEILHSRERSGPIPAGLGSPGRAAQPSVPPVPRAIPTPAAPIPHVVRSEPSSGTAGPNSKPRPRTPTPTRTSSPSASRTGASNTGGVVMTRPAVIVGAPAKSATPPRVRKAREDEGRGFGQGLISEKSLDEVILAYLSEDADDK
jgi:hypothetical protein